MAHEREVKTLLELPEVEQITDDLLWDNLAYISHRGLQVKSGLCHRLLL